jgi:hypothetical protein
MFCLSIPFVIIRFIVNMFFLVIPLPINILSLLPFCIYTFCIYAFCLYIFFVIIRFVTESVLTLAIIQLTLTNLQQKWEKGWQVASGQRLPIPPVASGEWGAVSSSNPFTRRAIPAVTGNWREQEI